MGTGYAGTAVGPVAAAHGGKDVRARRRQPAALLLGDAVFVDEVPLGHDLAPQVPMLCCDAGVDHAILAAPGAAALPSPSSTDQAARKPGFLKFGCLANSRALTV